MSSRVEDTCTYTATLSAAYLGKGLGGLHKAKVGVFPTLLSDTFHR